MRCALVTFLCLSSLLAACAPEGTSAYVSKNLILDSDCSVTVDDEKFLAVGEYDIAPSTTMKSTFCRKSYYMHLVVNSQLKAGANTATGRSEPNVLQISEAEVSLVDIEQQGLIQFKPKSGSELPNPFRVKSNITLEPTMGTDPTTGEVPIEAIPVGYASYLNNYVGKQIMAEVKIYGTTLGDIDVDFAPFSFPIHICQGCLSRCTKDSDANASKTDLYGENCDDNGAADGRLCIDRTCGPLATD